ncbi:DNA-binding response OmpR family regulator [Pedobacter sp. CAN_A7]|uniref:response regulator transcription factor n=1 Tax=Pedobacter sp. CAN_A7 TaxID=2787722 RepID=UPI0018C9EF1F
MKNKILIIEDEELILTFLQKRIEKENFDVDVARDGNEAISQIEKNKYDSIIVDLMLPFVSGFQLIGHIRADDKNEETPIIVVSALGNESTIIEALSIGANDFLKKPIALNVLLTKLKLLIGGTSLSYNA